MNESVTESAWDAVKKRLPLGTVMEGEVAEIVPYGVWVDLGIGFPGLLMATEAGLQPGQQPFECFEIGQSLTSKVLWYNDERQQLTLTRRA
jgi:ribosomal protein S1